MKLELIHLVQQSPLDVQRKELFLGWLHNDSSPAQQATILSPLAAVLE